MNVWLFALVSSSLWRANDVKVLRLLIVKQRWVYLAEPVELHCVADLPVSIPGWPDLPVALALAHESSVLLASGGETPSLSPGVGGIADPVDGWVVLDGGVVWVDEDALVVLVSTILVDPVGVEEPEGWESLTGLVLGKSLEGKLWSKLVDMVGPVLTVEAVLGGNTPSATLADTDAVHDVTLLGLVTHPAGLIWAGWVSKPDELWELAVFPAPEAEKVAHDIALLLGPKFTKVLVGTHVCKGRVRTVVAR